MLSYRSLSFATALLLTIGPTTIRAEKPIPVGNRIRVAWLQEQLGPEQAIQPETMEPELSLAPEPDLPQATQTQPTSLRSNDSSLFNVSLPDIDFGSPVEKSVVLEQLPVERMNLIGGAIAGPSNVVLGSEAAVRATTDTGDLLGSSLSNTGIYTRNESPIVNQTRIRGFRYDQIRVTNAGAAWFPIRPDFDTPLSRFDSSIVRDVITVKGPYLVRNGPGFAFIDVALADTPRHRCPDWGGYSKLLYNGNGDQWYARQSFNGGDNNSGWRIGYGHAGGSDYEAGDQSRIGASYKARDIDFAYGIDLSANASLEFSYLRNDLTDVQLAGQINDFDYLKSDGFNLRYTLENQSRFDLLSVNTWYNASEFAGGALSKAKDGGNFPGGLRGLNDSDRPVSLVTKGDNASKGIRAAMSWFGPADNQFTAGVDYTDVDQDYRHGFIGPDANSIVTPPIDLGGAIDFGVPLATQQDFGLFADTTLNLGDYITLRAGSRADFVESTARTVATPRPLSPPDSTIDPGPNPDQSFALAAAYLTGEFVLSPVWSADLGMGYAERAPSPTELYAETPFLNIIQQGGYFAPFGNNELAKEKLFQLDAGISGDYDVLQLGARGYHAWIDDFITIRPTLQGSPDADPRAGTSGAADPFHDPRFVNTQATTWGTEAYASLDLTSRISTFGTLSYTGGRDETIDTPLWGIAPMETILGIRWNGEACRGAPVPWGVEYSVRMADTQNRISLGPNAVLPRGQFDPETPTPAFTLHNIRGYYRVNRAVSLVAGIENIGDKLYREHLNSITDLSGGRRATRNGVLDGGVLGRGRNIYIGIQSRY